MGTNDNEKNRDRVNDNVWYRFGLRNKNQTSVTPTIILILFIIVVKFRKRNYFFYFVKRTRARLRSCDENDVSDHCTPGRTSVLRRVRANGKWSAAVRDARAVRLPVVGTWS